MSSTTAGLLSAPASIAEFVIRATEVLPAGHVPEELLGRSDGRERVDAEIREAEPVGHRERLLGPPKADYELAGQHLVARRPCKHSRHAG